MTFEGRVDGHYRTGGLLARIEAGLRDSGKDLESLTLDDLAPVDAFHTRGRAATRELAELAEIKSTDRVLDVGCGLGGTARHLADAYGCRVDGLDLTVEYIEVGTAFNRRVGLDSQVTLHCASALDIPFPDSFFDVVWTEHVQMNIVDKARFFGEIARVLKPGGHLLFHDIFLGNGGPPVFPTPWADDDSLSSLVTEAEARTVMEQTGLSVRCWISTVPESVAFFETVAARIGGAGLPPVGIHLLMGDQTGLKVRNLGRNLSEGRVTAALGVASKDHVSG